MKILIRSPNWLGDHIMAFDFYRSLREYYYTDHLTLLLPEVFIGLPFHSLFNEVLTFKKDKIRSVRYFLNLSKTLSEKQFDLGINLPISISSSLLLVLSKIPQRIGYSSGIVAAFHTCSIPWRGRGQHKSRRYMELFEWLSGTSSGNEGGQTVQSKPLRGRIEEGALRGSLDRSNLMVTDNERKENYIVIAPGASRPLREWPYFIELIQLIKQLLPQFKIKIVGTTKEYKWKSIFKRVFSNTVDDLIGETSIEELMRLCQNAKFVVANDSGVAHLAATMAHAETFVIFGPGDPEYIKPMGRYVIPIRKDGIPCSPCEKAKCHGSYGYQTCLKNLSPQLAMDFIINNLRQNPIPVSE